MIYVLEQSDKLLRKNGYATIFLRTENKELLFFYKFSLHSLKEVPVLFLDYQSNQKYIYIGCLLQSGNDIEFSGYLGIEKSSFNRNDLLERIKLVEDEISKRCSIKAYDEAIKDKLKFNNIDFLIWRFIKKNFNFRREMCEVYKRLPIKND